MIHGPIFGVKLSISSQNSEKLTWLHPLTQLLYRVSVPVVLQFTGLMREKRRHEVQNFEKPPAQAELSAELRDTSNFYSARRLSRCVVGLRGRLSSFLKNV